MTVVSVDAVQDQLDQRVDAAFEIETDVGGDEVFRDLRRDDAEGCDGDISVGPEERADHREDERGERGGENPGFVAARDVESVFEVERAAGWIRGR